MQTFEIATLGRRNSDIRIKPIPGRIISDPTCLTIEAGGMQASGHYVELVITDLKNKLAAAFRELQYNGTDTNNLRTFLIE